MSDLNKCILLVMKWLDNKDSVSKDEIVENRKAAAAYAYAYAYDAYDAAYAYDAAAAASSAATASSAEKWVNKYFERTGENKQDYIKAIEAEKRPQEPESKEWDGEGLPPIGCECEGLWLQVPDGGSPEWTKGRLKGGYDSKIWFGTSDFIEIVVPAHNIKFRPLKTQEQKDREAFIDACFAVSCALHNNANEHAFNDLFDAGFKAPEGE